MLTYDLTDASGPLYQHLYEHLKNDILSRKLEPNEKLPSKRTLAKNLGISTITVENAYNQLIGEGYLYAMQKKGYFVADISGNIPMKKPTPVELNIQLPDTLPEHIYDFSSNQTDAKNFPFSVWAKLMRETLSLREKELLQNSFCTGVRPLREAIAKHLASFRGMQVDPDQIVIGAGTEYLYGLLVKLLGTDKRYCVENPGYKKIVQIYESNGIQCTFANMDEQGIRVEELIAANADIAHISPTHHFPTGITMPISRRYELLAWANEHKDRYIIEDDYDSEFRLNGKPIPPLQNIDATEKVIYMNTFSKSLASTIRISYMILPAHLANAFYKNLAFYSCTVSTFEQFTLAEFIQRGYFEKHINRMRLYYVKKRQRTLDCIRACLDENQCRIIENDSGLHVLLALNTKLNDAQVEARLQKKAIRLVALSDYYQPPCRQDTHQFILNYSNLNLENLKDALITLKKEIF